MPQTVQPLDSTSSNASSSSEPYSNSQASNASSSTSIWGESSNQTSANSYAASNHQSAPHNPYAAMPLQAPSYTPYPPPQPGYQSSSDDNPLGLILGSISIVVALASCGCYGLISPVGLVLGIVAWVSSSRDRAKVAQGLARPSGIVDSGLILGIIGTLLSALVMLMFAVLIIGFVIHAANNPRRNF